MQNVIEIRNLRKIYYSEEDLVHALEGVNIKARESEFLSIVGPSGCGKSTLLKILAGLYPVTSGEVLVSGKKVRGPHPNIGIVFQSPALMKWRTVLSNILLQIEIRGIKITEFQPQAMSLIELVGLEGFANSYPHQLSGGMAQRVAICRALIHDPPLLLMDEPFGALDAFTREQMNLELMRIWSEKQKTVLFITHSISEAVFLSDRIIVLSARPGQVIKEIPVDLPRPRILTTMDSPKFVELVSEIRQLMQVESSLD
jgi:NitT/TauT family transport system ATP-binding protein